MGAFLSANFVNPTLLLGAGAILAPIIIWLVNKLRTQTVEWAAIEFLRRAVEKTRSRMRIEDIILLIIRCLIIIMLAITVARPRGTAIISVNEDSRKNVVLIIDSSYSMGFQVGSTENDTVFQRARVQSQDIINKLGRKDRLLMGILSDRLQVLQDTPRIMEKNGKVEALKALEDPEFRVSARMGNGPSLFHGLPALLEKFDQPGAKPSLKTVFILSDAQRSLFFKKNSLKDPSMTVLAEKISQLGGELVFVDCGNRKPQNVAFTKIGTRDPIVGVNLPCRFEVGLTNFSNEEVAGLKVEYFIDNMDAPIRSRSLRLKANQEYNLPAFRYEFKKPGPHRFKVRLSSDKLVIDNSRYMVVEVREAVQVLMINGEPRSGQDRWSDELHYFRGAMEPGGAGTDLIRPRGATPTQLDDIDLKPYDVIVIANVKTLSEAAVTRLESYTTNGGVVLWTMGGEIDDSYYNARLFRDGQGLLPVRLGDKLGRRDGNRSTEAAPEWEFEIQDKNFPGLSLFVDPEMRKWLKYPAIHRIFSVDNSDPKNLNGRVLLSFEKRARTDDDVGEGETKDVPAPSGPALVQKEYGRGYSLVLLTSLDADWNNGPAYDVFYVLAWRQIVLHLSQTSKPRRQLGIGESFDEYLTQEQYSKEVRIMRPDGQPTIQSPQEIKGEERFRLSYNNTQKPGIYTVEFTDSPSKRSLYFAVNIDAREGNLEKLSVEEMREALPGLKIRLMDNEEFNEATESAQAGGANEFWKMALTAVLALLVLESVLAMMFGRRRQ